jgi:hypothetical protein
MLFLKGNLFDTFPVILVGNVPKKTMVFYIKFRMWRPDLRSEDGKSAKPVHLPSSMF